MRKINLIKKYDFWLRYQLYLKDGYWGYLIKERRNEQLLFIPIVMSRLAVRKLVFFYIQLQVLQDKSPVENHSIPGLFLNQGLGNPYSYDSGLMANQYFQLTDPAPLAHCTCSKEPTNTCPSTQTIAVSVPTQVQGPLCVSPS